MMQIENEIGMLESARDHSPLAEKAYKQERWAERYGTDEYADEKFMALSYARYVEHLAKAARELHDMPLYVNAAMNSRGRRPGEYPSAGPLAHLIDFKTPSEKQQEQQKTLGEDGFAEAGGNNNLKVNKRFSGKRLGLLSVDEVSIDDDGTMQYLRRHNGDQTHQGRHARIGVGEWKLLHIKLYEY